MAASSGSSRLMIWLALLFLQVVLIFIAVPADKIGESVAKEEAMLAEAFGRPSANKIRKRARELYARIFEDSGVVDETYSFFLPTDEALRKSKGMEELGVREGWWAGFRARLDAFWMMVYFVLLRLYTIMLWWPLMAIFLAAAAYDGLVSRRIKLLGFESTSAPVYGMAMHIFVFMMFVPFFYAFSPLPMNPVAIPFWGILVAILVKVKAANLQRF